MQVVTKVHGQPPIVLANASESSPPTPLIDVMRGSGRCEKPDLTPPEIYGLTTTASRLIDWSEHHRRRPREEKKASVPFPCIEIAL